MIVWKDKSFEAENINAFQKYRLDIQLSASDIRLHVSKLKSKKSIAIDNIELNWASLDDFTTDSLNNALSKSEIPTKNIYGSVGFTVNCTSFTLLPNALVDKNTVSKVLQLNADVKPTDSIYISKIKYEDYSIIYGYNKQISTFIKNTFPSASMASFLKVLLCSVQNNKKEKENTLYLHFQNDIIHIIHYKGEALQFINQYSVKGDSDVLYYLTLVIDSLAISNDSFTLNLLGEIQKNGKLVELLSKYIPTINFPNLTELTTDSNLDFGIPNHYLTTLLNQKTCV